MADPNQSFLLSSDLHESYIFQYVGVNCRRRFVRLSTTINKLAVVSVNHHYRQVYHCDGYLSVRLLSVLIIATGRCITVTVT